MPNIVVVNRDGSLKSVSIKSDSWNESELYKKAGFKIETGFDVQGKFRVGKDRCVKVYGKVNGKANTENKYDFPPPIDNTLFFGNCLLVLTNTETKQVLDLTMDEWEKMYERLFGGFEDLNSNGGAIVADMIDQKMDEMEMTEEEKKILADPNTKFSRQGYVMDGFIVDDEDTDEDEEDIEEESDESVQLPKKKRSSVAVQSRRKKTTTESVVVSSKTMKGRTPSNKDKKPTKSGKVSKTKMVSSQVNNQQEDESNDCTEELTEEAYFA